MRMLGWPGPRSVSNAVRGARPPTRTPRSRKKSSECPSNSRLRLRLPQTDERARSAKRKRSSAASRSPCASASFACAISRVRVTSARAPASLRGSERASSTRTWNPCCASTSAQASPHVLAPTTMALSSRPKAICGYGFSQLQHFPPFPYQNTYLRIICCGPSFFAKSTRSASSDPLKGAVSHLASRSGSTSWSRSQGWAWIFVWTLAPRLSANCSRIAKGRRPELPHRGRARSRDVPSMLQSELVRDIELLVIVNVDPDVLVQAIDELLQAPLILVDPTVAEQAFDRFPDEDERLVGEWVGDLLAGVAARRHDSLERD